MFAWRRNRTVICTQSDLNHTWLSSIRDPPRPHPASFPDIEALVCLDHPLHSCSSVALLLHVGMLEIATMKHNRFCLGIRSLAFNSEVLSFGTGSGYIFFFDLRAMKYLEMNCSHALVLKGGKGWTRVRIRCFCLLTKFSSKTNLVWFKKLNNCLFSLKMRTCITDSENRRRLQSTRIATTNLERASSRLVDRCARTCVETMQHCGSDRVHL